MERRTLFYHAKNADCIRAERLLAKSNYDFHLLDINATGISSCIFKDMRISTLPALYIVSGEKHKLYEGLGKIEALLKTT